MPTDADGRPAPSTLQPDADEAVVAAVLRGDRDRFRVLVEREGPDLVRACYRVLGSREDAEEAAQEAFVIAYRSLGSWRGEGSFGAWLARIGVRVALRRAASRRTVAWIDATAPTSQVERAAAEAGWGGASAIDPARLIVQTEAATAVRAAVSRLDEPYRETVAMRFFGQRSLAEIAAVTGRPVGTVKTHLHRGLLRLRTEFEREAVA